MKPLFLLSKGERNRAEDGIVDTVDILIHYAEVYSDRMIYKGTPRDMPRGFIEKALFWTGGVGPVEAFGENQLAGGSPILKGMYGEAVTWMPVAPEGTVLPPEVMESHDGREYPLLQIPVPMSWRIEPLCALMAQAYKCLASSIQGMKQPVIMEGVAGGEINVVETGDRLRKGELQIFTLDRTSMNAKVLDLGGKDHTQNLISTINALDCEILARMGIKSAGTEKASGVTTEETVSITQELSLANRADLMLRREWIEKVKDRFPSLSVRLAPELEVYDDGSGDTDQESSSVSGDEVA